jgi:hypothetical protein
MNEAQGANQEISDDNDNDHVGESCSTTVQFQAVGQ